MERNLKPKLTFEINSNRYILRWESMTKVTCWYKLEQYMFSKGPRDVLLLFPRLQCWEFQ